MNNRTELYATRTTDGGKGERVQLREAMLAIGSALLHGDLVEPREEQRPGGPVTVTVTVKTSGGATAYQYVRGY